MDITLDHLLIPAADRVAAARRVGELFGVEWAEQGPIGPFSPVYVSPSLTLLFCQWPGPVPQQHYAFRVDDERFDSILARLVAAGIAYRSHPLGEDDGQINTAFGGRLVYWREPDGHAWEMLTVSYERPGALPPG